jgi:hypothetical protein
MLGQRQGDRVTFSTGDRLMSSVELPVKRPCDAHMNTLPAPSLLMRLHSTDSWAAVSGRKSEEEVREKKS